MDAATHVLSMSGAMLRRGFWLYVWKVTTPTGELLYVGRTGDNSSPNATAPYTRMGQHLGYAKTQNALRKHLEKRSIDLLSCNRFDFIAHGPLHDEITKTEGSARATLMAQHTPLRNSVGAMEKALAEELSAVGYTVLNTVRWNPKLDETLWAPVREAFAVHFPLLCTSASKEHS